MAKWRISWLALASCCACALAADPYRANWISVADRLIQNPPEMFPYDWGEGVQQIGLMKTYERTRDPRYLDWMRRWAALYEKQDPRDLLHTGETARAAGRTGYCGHWSPATAILLLNRASPRPEYRRIVEATLGFIHSGAERSPEGALGHWQGSHQLWVDTLYMACPLLAAEGKKQSVRDAAQQIILYANHLQDTKTGLFFHMWDWQTGERSQGAWGRGNGWVIMSIADTVEVLDRRDPAFGKLTAVMDKLVTGFAASQDESGMWRTVLDDPQSYEETSATSMTVYGILKLVRLGRLPRTRMALAMKAWQAVNQRFVHDGLVTGVSAGTVPKGSEYYRNLPASTQTWGTGAYLLAGSEVDRLR
ncbi:MAG: glycoside hydrolase family 88 protein [Bryobacteraceae bacterium]